MSDDSEDDYAEFGTPLEALDEDVCPRKKPFTIEEQFARDKHGRRRFHGAFSGGFSAGFLNTVGSLEGWKPSSYKSSKSEKAVSIEQKPEHFMDEEDMGEFGIAPSILQAKADFSHNTSVKRKHSNFYDGSFMAADILKTLLQPVRETVGIKLLRKMGWKPGQGVGPRIGRHEKQRTMKIRKKVYGCLSQDGKVEPETESESDDDVAWESLTFAPEDYLPHIISPKEDIFGLGYKGLDKKSILSVPQRKCHLQMKNKQAIHGQAFGVGVFEEEDEDIYCRDDMSQYDFSLDHPAQNVERMSDQNSSDNLFEGFVLSLTKIVKKVFPPPVLPSNFTTLRKSRVSRFEPVSPEQCSRKSCLSPKREDSMEEIENIQKLARKITESTDNVSNSQTFKPFMSDFDKQNRYEKFLDLMAIGKKDTFKRLQPITMTDWEKEREIVEFQQAAKLFGSISGVMQDRFITASQPDDIHDPLAVVEKLRHESEEVTQAAKMNMYGKLTRTVEDWKPCSLLCKRFNVPELNISEIPIVKKKPKYSIFDNLEVRPEVREQFQEIAGVREKSTEKAENSEKVKDTKFQDSKNQIDLFNAIFLDTDTEEEETKNAVSMPSSSERGSDTAKSQSESLPTNATTENEICFEENITNDKRNTSPARGIFEKLDYLLRTKKESKKIEDECKYFGIAPGNDPVAVGTELGSDQVYGPRLPDKFPVSKERVPFKPDISIDCWIEKDTRRKYKKKSKKNKKSKHKSKHKHKKSKK